MRPTCANCSHEWEYHYHGGRCQVSGCKCRGFATSQVVDPMQWLSATWTRSIITTVVMLAMIAVIKIGREQGWYPNDLSWGSCAGDLSTFEPCVTQDGSLMVTHDGRQIVYPMKEE